jgi:hypothetical protein
MLCFFKIGFFLKNELDLKIGLLLFPEPEFIPNGLSETV